MGVVLITGCSSGFGLDTAIAFAQRGDTVVATMRNLAKSDRLEKAAADAGVDVEIVELDVVDDGDTAQRPIRDELGRRRRHLPLPTY